MTEPHDPNRTVDVPSASADSLDAGLAASFGRPAVAAQLEPPGRHDACFLPRSSYITGNSQSHEMAWGAEGQLQEEGVRCGTSFYVYCLPYPNYWGTLTPQISPDLPQLPQLTSGTSGLICYRRPPTSGWSLRCCALAARTPTRYATRRCHNDVVSPQAQSPR